MSCVPARALFHTAPRCVEIRELPTPRPAASEVLVRTVCSGNSGGTQRLVYRGEVPAELALDDTIDALGGSFSYPFAYGYACVGEVAESGQAVFAFHPHQDIFAARASDLIPLPGIDPASATLLPLVETALQVTLDAGTGYRDRVIVLGAGVLGLLTGLLLQRAGWRPLIAELLPELPLAQLCTHVFDFGAAAEAFRAVDQGEPGLMHAVLNYDRSATGDL